MNSKTMMVINHLASTVFEEKRWMHLKIRAEAPKNILKHPKPKKLKPSMGKIMKVFKTMKSLLGETPILLSRPLNDI